MGQINIVKTPMEDLYLIEPVVHRDGRGYFVETYHQEDLRQAGLDLVFVQDNQSMSVKGVLRGLHFQKHFPQGKLVRAAYGAIFDVVVDLRPGSRSWGQWFGTELTEENQRQLYIPKGFAHGFLTLSDRAVVCYKVTDFYHPDDEGGLAWNDPRIGICWPGVHGVYTGTATPEHYYLEDGTKLKLNSQDQTWPGLKGDGIYAAD